MPRQSTRPTRKAAARAVSSPISKEKRSPSTSPKKNSRTKQSPSPNPKKGAKKAAPARKRGRNTSSLTPEPEEVTSITKENASDQVNGRPTQTSPRAKRQKAVSDFNIPFPFTRTGEVFVVGSGDCGQLGLGPDVLEKEKVGLLQYFRDKNIVSIVAGGLHNIALDINGKLYSWGCNDQLALGRGGEETEPAPVDGLEDKVVVQVACGDSISAALTQDGQVYSWGTFRNSTGIFGYYPGIEIQPRPRLVKELPKHVVQIAAGNNHLVAITKEGKMYTWGVGEQGQLGHKVISRHTKEGSLIPRRINFYPKGISKNGRRVKKNFTRVFCGGYTTYLVHESNAVYAYGLNNYGQLGVGPTSEEVYDPMLIDGVDPENGLQAIAGGEHHTLYLDDKGDVYAFGRGDSGQLGLGNTVERQKTPVKIPTLSNVRSISANGSFSLAVCHPAENETVSNFYTWGYGDMGQLANQGAGDEEAPFHVDFKGREAITASAGGQHTVILVEPKPAQPKSE
ncbi:hypothetical protein SpCBS45565_g05868 [Spizellomyces sp. 'palustris']|nr:hypothetical protein SpCBS45565_g05868 [Spizellomyces sp. 'palustris']